MKNLFTKFLLLAVCAGAFIACEKNEDTPAPPRDNGIKLGEQVIQIIGVKTSATQFLRTFKFIGPGLSFSSDMGKGDKLEIEVGNEPGTYTVGKDEIADGEFYKNFNGITESAEDTYWLYDNTTITWSVEGDIYTIDIQGTVISEKDDTESAFSCYYSGPMSSGFAQ